MHSFTCSFFITVALLGLEVACQSPAAADELVRFASAAPPLHQAERTNIGANPPRRAPDVQGYLTKPKGHGPFPAVVLLHSCLGLRADRRSITSTLASWGYVALFVDDFTEHGIRETCAVDFPEAAPDAFGALAFIATLPDVDKTRIGVIGYSQGADTALQIAASRFRSAVAIPKDVAFKAAVAFYPPCENLSGTRLQLPTLILIGAADAVTPAAACERLVSKQPAANVKLVVYPGVGHVFDDPEFTGGRRVLDMWLQFDERAAAQSKSALREFLATKLAR
jgi:dienelactone hydrolase